MQVEDIAWISLPCWWSPKKQTHLSVADRMLREIIVHSTGSFAYWSLAIDRLRQHQVASRKRGSRSRLTCERPVTGQ